MLYNACTIKLERIKSMKKTVSLLLVAAILCVLLCSCGSSAKIKYISIKLTDEQYAFAVAKDNADLLATANEVLSEIKSNGKLDELINKYFGDASSDIKYYEAGTVDTSKKQLVVATNTPFSPFEYKEGNKYCGIDIEIAEMIAQKIDAELVIMDMDFDAILTAVETGKADIAMAGLTYSEKRAEIVNFTDTYYNASQVIVCKDGDTTFDACKTPEDVEAILKSFGSDTVIGYQNGTTAGLYLKGDEDWGFEGFDVTATGYSSATVAVQAMLNGQINFVVVDEGPAQFIVKAINK